LENPRFHGFKDILRQIETHFSTTEGPSQKRVVLYGLPGAGKSELALKYASTHRNDYHGVFWISAQHAGQNQSMAILQAEIARIEAKNEFEFVRWCGRPDRKWLLIIDNLDGIEGFSSANFSQLVPQGGKGHIIITSRRVRAGLFGTMALKVEPLEEQIAAALLLDASYNRRKTVDDEEAAIRVVRLLGCLPLAVQHCASYLSSRELSVNEYPLLFDSFINNLTQSESDPTIESYHGIIYESKEVVASWQLSFDHVASTNPASADILDIMAFLDATEMDEHVFTRGVVRQQKWDPEGDLVNMPQEGFASESLQELSNSRDAGAKMAKALEVLIDFSLVFRNRSGRSFRLHPVSTLS
jgi:hypothetical protein